MYFEDYIKIGLTVLLALFVFFTFINPLDKLAAEALPITTNDVYNYLTDLDKENNDLRMQQNKLLSEVDYWSSIDQAAEIKQLRERPTRMRFNTAIIFMLTFAALIIILIFLFISMSNQRDKYKARTTEIKSIVYTSNLADKEKLKELKSDFKYWEDNDKA